MKMSSTLTFADEDMVVDQGLGYPRAYAKLCRDRSLSPYNHGPPFTYCPYVLQQQEAMRAKELEEMFPIIDPQAKPTTKPRIFFNILWKQLNHLGNAGFDPAMFRVDPYGNVLYYHADSASPLAWEIDHWFPLSRGGLTVPSNLRILQWQVYKRKHNKLEILVPWWDLQLGISINQFLSIFAASNSDFRHRAFFMLFRDGKMEELNDSQSVDSHNFPQHYIESKERLGLAPAAIVEMRKESYDAPSTLRSLDINRQPRPFTPIIAAARKSKHGIMKENENPDLVTNPYKAIVLARDSLKQREETTKMKAEIQRLDNEVSDLKHRNEDEKSNIQDLEMTLIKHRRRAEKCRKLAESQSSYRTMLEKMIRDAMHQSVVYKEQVRLNQAAANALMARLEAQRAICDSAEKDLHKKFKQRDDLESQVRPESEQARKRSRLDDTLYKESNYNGTIPYLLEMKPKTPVHKELRVFLEEEHKLSEAGQSHDEEDRLEEIEEVEQQRFQGDILAECVEPIGALDYGLGESGKYKFRFGFDREPEVEEDEETRKEKGKGNVEKWLHMLLENGEGSSSSSHYPQPQTPQEPESSKKTDESSKNHYPQPPPPQEPESSKKTDEILRKLNETYPLKARKVSRYPGFDEKMPNRSMRKDRGKKKLEIVEMEAKKQPRSVSTPPRSSVSTPRIVVRGEANEACGRSNEKMIETRKSFGGGMTVGAEDRGRKGKGVERSESARAFRRIPSSPSLILGMRKGVECMRKKPLVDGEDSEEEYIGGKSFLRSSFEAIKKTVKM